MRGFKGLGLRSGALLMAGAAWAPSAVLAQDSAAAATDTAGEGGVEAVKQGDGGIIVTARRFVPSGAITASKTTAPLIETPQSVSVISRDQIDLLNFVDVQQAVRYTAGIVGENYGPDLRFDFLTLRGFVPVQYVDGLQAPVSSTRRGRSPAGRATRPAPSSAAGSELRHETPGPAAASAMSFVT